MGIVVWLASGAIAFLLARIVPLGRARGWIAELLTAIVTALLLGVVATALDFGGWKQADGRAGAFAFFGALAFIGIVRSVRWRPAPAGEASPDRRRGDSSPSR